MNRRKLLATCSLLALPGCTLFDSEKPTAPTEGPGPSWPTYRGNVAGTGRADTALEPPYEVETLWQFHRSLSVPSSTMPVPNAGVAVADEAVYATAADLHFPPHAVARTGPELLWRFDEVVDETRAEEFYRTPSPVAVGNDVFVYTSWRLSRIDGPAGELVWFEGGGVPRHAPLVGDESGLYYPNSVTRIDPATGETRGTHRFRSDGVFEGLAVGDDAAVVAVRTDGGHDGLIAAYDVDDWSVQWRDEVDAPVWEAPAIHDGTAVAVTDASHETTRGAGGATIAYDLEDGSERWRAETPDARIGAAVHEDGTVYVPHRTGGLLALDAEDDGARLWTAGEPLDALVGDPDGCYPPIVADDAVVLAGRKGLAILDRADGSVRQRVDERLAGAPAVADGDVYAITDGRIVAVRGNA